MSHYGWTEDHVQHMDGAKGWAYYHWAKANESTVWGTGERLKLGAYVRQETVAVLKLKEQKNG